MNQGHHIKINKLHLLQTSTPIITANGSTDPNSRVLHFSPDDFPIGGLWTLDTNDTSRILCNRAGTYTIDCKISYRYEEYLSLKKYKFWMQYNNDKNSFTSTDSKNINFTYNFPAGKYINFFVCNVDTSCNVAVYSYCTLNIY